MSFEEKSPRELCCPGEGQFGKNKSGGKERRQTSWRPSNLGADREGKGLPIPPGQCRNLHLRFGGQGK